MLRQIVIVIAAVGIANAWGDPPEREPVNVASLRMVSEWPRWQVEMYVVQVTDVLADGASSDGNFERGWMSLRVVKPIGRGGLLKSLDIPYGLAKRPITKDGSTSIWAGFARLSVGDTLAVVVVPNSYDAMLARAPRPSTKDSTVLTDEDEETAKRVPESAVGASTRPSQYAACYLAHVKGAEDPLVRDLEELAELFSARGDKKEPAILAGRARLGIVSDYISQRQKQIGARDGAGR